MSAYRLTPFVLAFIWLAVGVWFCSRSPLWLAKVIDKEVVGSFAAYIRSLKKPEPYKGKGFRYDDEVIRRKQGKKSA